MKVHLVGLGGIGMSGLAQLLLLKRQNVSGSDEKDGPILDRIRAMGGKVMIGHSASYLNSPDLVVYSSSIPPQNPEILLARNQGIPVLHRGQMLAHLVAKTKTIAVTGAHGKSTTASLAAELLTRAGLDPFVLLGAEVESLRGNARYGKGPYAVVEADESDGSLLWLKPAMIVVTNIDEEHLDYFRNMGEILECYAAFMNRLAPGGVLIGCEDDPKVKELMAVLRCPKITYGLSPQAQIRAEDLKCGAGWSRYRCVSQGKRLGFIQLKIPGIHNLVNSLAVVALAKALKIDFPIVKEALEGYRGARRRFQIAGEVHRILVVEDYGHHPAEIQATLKAARDFRPKRIWAIFQPHRYTRTRYLLNRFSTCFHLADEVILLPIYPASEDPMDGVTSQRLLEAIRSAGKQSVCLLSEEETLNRLVAQAQPGDLILFLGAGSIGGMAERFVEALKRRVD